MSADDDPFADLDRAATAIRPQGAHRPILSFQLAVFEGREAGATWVVDSTQPEPVLVGQGPACGIRLRDPEVSRRHIELYADERRLRIRDLGSTNGTFVNGVSVVEAYLSGGETIRIGSTAIGVSGGPLEARPAASATHGFGRFLGSSPEIVRLYPLIARLAATHVPIVIEGETGTGKEILAEAIHEASPRAAGPYVVFDCTAVPASLMESELFGHDKGAFTGATSGRKGVFEQASGGTLLIDEIGDLEASLQPKLLRAIERGEIRRIGGDRPMHVDVRVLAATRRDLDQEVQSGRFRDDLFHRLAVGRIALPPLRRRRGDVNLLARHFWAQFGGSGSPPEELLDRWEADLWPGNTRELRNTVARQLALGDLVVLQGLDEADVPSRRPSVPPASAAPGRPTDFLSTLLAEKLPFPVARLKILQEFEQRYISQVLSEHGGNAARAAAALGIGRRYLDVLRRRIAPR